MKDFVDQRIIALQEENCALNEHITRLSRQILALQENEEQYRMIFQQAAAGFAHVNLEGRFLNVNQKLCDMLGYSADELLTKRWIDITHPGHLGGNLEGRDQMLSGEISTYVTDKQYVRKDGQPIWVHLTVSLIRTPEGRPKYFVSISEDITQRKREQELLFDSEQRLQSILDHTTAVVYVKDRAGRYRLVNRRYEELFHVAQGQILGRTDFEIFPIEVAQKLRANDLTVLESRMPLEREEVVLQNNELHTYISVKVPLVDAQGQAVAMCGISTDITERKQAEAELIRAKEAAEQANRAKSQFLANISHEIRTPIMALLAAAEVLRGGQPHDEQVAEHSEVVLRSGRHLLSLVDDLLDQSRIDSGRLQVACELCSLAELMADVYAVTTPLLKKPVTLQFLYETDVPEHITTDRKRLAQAIINLVHNAIKFTQQGHIHVRISAELVEQSPFLCVAVEDTGEGIAPGDLGRIFEPFTQLKAGTRYPSSGMGLGLALARSIALRLGGSLDVRSELSLGSTFLLRVPVSPLDGGPWASREAASTWCLLGANESMPAITLSGSVLLAEDSEDVRRLMTEALRRAGAEVVSVSDGEGAIQAMSAASFDLVLLDIRMPGVGGLEAARLIRNHGYAGPLIALTASTARSEYERILAAGFDDLWPKPISLEKLLTLSSAYLEGGAESPGCDPGMARKVNEIREDYSRRLGGVVQSLRQAVDARDESRVREILHMLAGSSGVMGLAEFSVQAALVYQMSKAGRLTSRSPELRCLEELAEKAAPPAPMGKT